MVAWIIHAAGGVESAGVNSLKWLAIFFRQLCCTEPVRPAGRGTGRGLCLGKASKTPLPSLCSAGAAAPSLQLQALLARAVVNAQQLPGIVDDTIKKTKSN